MLNLPSGRSGPAQLGIVRMAMLGGVLLFGAVTWFLHRRPGYVPLGGMDGLRPFLPLIMVIAALGVIGIRWYLSRVRSDETVRNAQLGAWTLGETAALSGGVYYFTNDDPRYYIVGLFVMLASFIIVPLRR
jgi:hypothetical protein